MSAAVAGAGRREPGGPAFIPLDDRPCTRDFPQQLAPLAGWRLSVPPLDLLGWCERSGDGDALLDWLEAAPGEDGAILSVEMLLYGGLVASRRLDLSEGDVARRAERLAALLPRLRGVSASSVVMRVPPYCMSDADRRFSERLLAWSQAAARAEAGRLGARWRAAALERALPADFAARYQAARARNHRVNLRFLDWARQGLVDFALLGMDDSRTEGFNVVERRALEPRVQELGAAAALIPGADELALLLLARMALARARRRPTVELRCAPDALRDRVTRYEDRPVGALLEAHCRAAGLEIVAEGGDVLLHVHGPARAQAEAATQLLRRAPSRRVRSEARAIAADLAAGRFVAVVDLGYANGGDRAFVEALAQEVPLAELGAYAAWNTAGNTVGTALAHAVLRWLSLRRAAREAEAVRAHVRFLVERFVDDWAWQAVARQEVGAWCAVRGLNTYALGDRHREVEAEAARRLAPVAEDFFAKHFAGRELRGPGGSRWRVGAGASLRVGLPWPRIFEVRVECEAGVEPA